MNRSPLYHTSISVESCTYGTRMQTMKRQVTVLAHTATPDKLLSLLLPAIFEVYFERHPRRWRSGSRLG